MLTTAGLASGVSVIISFIVCGVAGLIVKIWLEGKIQSQITSNETKLKKIQAELDKGSHVHRIQFEKEFDIYEKIWG